MPSDLLVAVSSKVDGTMLDRTLEFHSPEEIANRQKFCAANNLHYDAVVYQRIIYDEEQTYDKIVEVNENHTTQFTPEVAADGLFTKTRSIGLMLPVADCVATTIYDPVNHYLAIVHLGRHSTFTNIVSDMVAKFVSQGSDPKDLLVYTSPAAQRASYRLEYFDYADDPAWQGYYDRKDDGFYLDLPGFNRQQFIKAGLLAENLSISAIDTVTSDDYFSHMSGDTTGRFVMLAMMK